MANWGVPDFDANAPEQRRIDAEAEALRQRLASKGLMYEWPHNDLVERGYNQALVQIWCVRHEAWQRCRLSMKGVPTHKKLEILKAWWDAHYGQKRLDSGLDVCAIQVGNYLGALRRGGQLDDWNRVRKYQ